MPASYIGFDLHTIATYILLTSNAEIIVRGHCWYFFIAVNLFMPIKYLKDMMQVWKYE